MFIIAWKGGYLRKFDGCNSVVKSQMDATVFLTKEDAMAGRAGHDRAMGGNGYSGTVLPKTEYYEN